MRFILLAFLLFISGCFSFPTAVSIPEEINTKPTNTVQVDKKGGAVIFFFIGSSKMQEAFQKAYLELQEKCPNGKVINTRGWIEYYMFWGGMYSSYSIHLQGECVLPKTKKD